MFLICAAASTRKKQSTKEKVLIRPVEWIRRAPREQKREKGFESRILRAKCSRVLDVTRIIRGEVTQWKPCSTFASAPSSPKAAAGRRGRDKRSKTTRRENKAWQDATLFLLFASSVSLIQAYKWKKSIYARETPLAHPGRKSLSILLSAPTQEWMRETRLLFSVKYRAELRANGWKGSTYKKDGELLRFHVFKNNSMV